MYSKRVGFSFSQGIRNIVGIENLLGLEQVLSPKELGLEEQEAACALVWGRKQSGKRAVAWAEKQCVPIWHLEDGFIRTSSSNAHSRLTYSIIVDDVGVYYDANTPSLLENFLNDPAGLPAYDSDKELQGYIADCRKKLIENNITKYNFCADINNNSPVLNSEKPIVLVIDQTYDDASVNYGCMSSTDFQDMLECAVNENPGAQIVVKSHPDVVTGRKKGYLTDLANKMSVPLLTELVNPISVLKKVSAVYCGTSQMGFEALLCGLPVSVFGLPFYAGWGVTDDRKSIPRRQQQRSVDQLFYASYDWYSRYCNPVTGQRWSLAECIQHVCLQKELFQANSKHFSAIGITPWKKKYIKHYLRSPSGTVTFNSKNVDKPNVVSEYETTSDKSSNMPESKQIVTWGYKTMVTVSDSSVGEQNIMRVEDGFLRSMGLGSDFSAPQSLVFDKQGLYFNCNKNSDLEDILNNHCCTLPESHRATRLISLIISRKLSKYNVGNNSGDTPFRDSPITTRKLLVIGQVENDASLKFGCKDISDNTSLIECVRKANPDAYIVFKPHPDVVAGNRKGQVSTEVTSSSVNRIASSENVIDCIEACDEVHTMTSLSGFEALLRRKKVVTYGIPFYAGWGLTTDRHQILRRKTKRTLEELVFCTLIKYPRYLDIDTGEFITPEDFVVCISGKREMYKNSIRWSDRQVLKLKNVYKGLSYAP